jgi:hypothetical protein
MHPSRAQGSGVVGPRGVNQQWKWVPRLLQRMLCAVMCVQPGQRAGRLQSRVLLQVAVAQAQA